MEGFFSAQDKTCNETHIFISISSCLWFDEGFSQKAVEVLLSHTEQGDYSPQELAFPLHFEVPHSFISFSCISVSVQLMTNPKNVKRKGGEDLN